MFSLVLSQSTNPIHSIRRKKEKGRLVKRRKAEWFSLVPGTCAGLHAELRKKETKREGNDELEKDMFICALMRFRKVL